MGTDSALTLQDKLLYGQILSLTKKTGFCFANNSYLSELNNVTPKTISNSITNLKKNNYIRVEYHKEEINKYKRKRYKVMTIITSMIYLIFIILFKSSVASSFLCFGLLDASLMIHPFVYRMFQLPYDNYKNYIVTYR